MNRKAITLFIVFLALIIIVIIAANYLNSKPKKAKINPYEYNIDEFKKVDPSLISYKEVRQIKVDMEEKGAISSHNGMIWIATDRSVKSITPEGKIASSFQIDNHPGSIAVNEKEIAVGFRDRFIVYSYNGEKLYSSEKINDSTVITSLAFWDKKIVVADAGKRKVYIFNNGKKEKEIEGVSGTKNLHGFIIPSPYFDIAVNSQNELWVANTGMHSLQQYDESGNVVRSWEKKSLEIDGFSGCCNPAHFTFLPDGRFVTSEKGMPRIKIYSVNGKLESVVAAPDQFREDGHAPEVTTVNETIVVLDYDRKMIRIFEKK